MKNPLKSRFVSAVRKRIPGLITYIQEQAGKIARATQALFTGEKKPVSVQSGFMKKKSGKHKRSSRSRRQNRKAKAAPATKQVENAIPVAQPVKPAEQAASAQIRDAIPVHEAVAPAGEPVAPVGDTAQHEEIVETTLEETPPAEPPSEEANELVAPVGDTDQLDEIVETISEEAPPAEETNEEAGEPVAPVGDTITPEEVVETTLEEKPPAEETNGEAGEPVAPAGDTVQPEVEVAAPSEEPAAQEDTEEVTGEEVDETPVDQSEQEEAKPTELVPGIYMDEPVVQEDAGDQPDEEPVASAGDTNQPDEEVETADDAAEGSTDKPVEQTDTDNQPDEEVEAVSEETEDTTEEQAEPQPPVSERRAALEEKFLGSEDALQVQLEIFEGPLDLLVFLVRKNEYDIFDIPIATITEQYLQILDVMKSLNLDMAGDFLVMAATLMKLKSRLLLPPSDEDEDDEGEDPRAELAAQLAEYMRYKEAAEELVDRQQLDRDLFARKFMPDEASAIVAEGGPLEVSIFDLIEAFSNVAKNLNIDMSHNVAAARISVAQRINELLEFFGDREKVEFAELFEGSVNRIDIIVTFLAILEVVRLSLVSAYQSDRYGGIHLALRKESQEKTGSDSGDEDDDEDWKALENSQKNSGASQEEEHEEAGNEDSDDSQNEEKDEEDSAADDEPADNEEN